MKKWVGVFQVLLSGVGFGFLGIFGRWAFAEGLSIGELLFWRFTLAAGLLWLFWAFRLLIFPKSHKGITLQQATLSLLLGCLGYAVFSTLYFESIRGVSVALAAMLLFTFPIFVSLGSHFFLKELLQKAQWASLAVASLGLILLLWGDLTVRSPSAVFMGLGAGLTYAVYVLISGRLQKNVDPLASSRFVITGAAIGLFLFHRPVIERSGSFSSHQFALILGIAFVCSIAPIALFLAGLQKMKSSRASLLVMIEPVVATTAAWTLLGETLSLYQLIGAVLVMAALVTNTLLQ